MLNSAAIGNSKKNHETTRRAVGLSNAPKTLCPTTKRKQMRKPHTDTKDILVPRIGARIGDFSFGRKASMREPARQKTRIAARNKPTGT